MTNAKFKPGQLVVVKCVWDSKTKIYIEEENILGIYVKTIYTDKDRRRSSHVVILYGDRMVHTYEQYIRAPRL